LREDRADLHNWQAGFDERGFLLMANSAEQKPNRPGKRHSRNERLPTPADFTTIPTSARFAPFPMKCRAILLLVSN
jgi:hypothetical protein